MTNRGTIANSGSDAWRYYRPEMLTAANGAVTQPVIVEDSLGSQSTYPFGRYTIDEDGLVTVEIQTGFIGSTTVGAGTAYVWSLPVKARRAVPGSACVYPIGEGLCYFSFSNPAVNVRCAVLLADPWTSLGNAEDGYCQMIAPYVLSWGSGTILSGASSATVNHRAGHAIDAADIEIVATDADLPVTSPYHAINSTNSTQMVVQTRTNATADHAFDWKVRAEPDGGKAFVSPTVPFDWSRFTSLTPFANFFLQLNYEAA